MRKAIAFIMIGIFLLGSLPENVFATSEADGKISVGKEVLTGLGMLDTNESGTNKITRQQWVDWIVEFSYNENLQGIDLAQAGIYSNTDYYFMPDNAITLSDGVIMMVKLLGYQLGPEKRDAEYLTIARRLRLLKGVNKGINEDITYEDAYNLIFNYLNAHLATYKIVRGNMVAEEGDATLLEQKYDVSELHGQVDATPHYTLSGNSYIADSQISISGIICENSRYKADDLFGRQVTAYVRDLDGRPEVIAIIVDKAVNVNVIYTKDAPGLSQRTITYYDGKDKTKKISFSVKANIFYNGERYIYDASSFIPTEGRITVIDNGIYSDGADIVLIESAQDIKISVLRRSEMLVYPYSSTKIYNMDDEDILLTDSKGAQVPFEQLAVDDVLTLYVKQNGNIWKAVLCTDTAQGVVSEITRTGYVISGQEYEMSSDLKALFSDKLTLGKTVTAVLNPWGKIADIIESANRNQLVGILLKGSFTSGLFEEESVALRIYSDSGKLLVYPCADKVTINGERYKEKDIRAHLPYLDGTNQLEQTIILYELNSSGEISSIEYPSKKIMDKESGAGLYRTYGVESANSNHVSYNVWQKRLGYELMVEPSKTCVFQVPKQGEDGAVESREELFSITKLNQVTTGKEYPKESRITGYSLDSSSKVSDYVVIEYNSGLGSAQKVNSDTRVSIVNDIIKTVTDEGEVVEAVEIYNSGYPDGIVINGKDETYFSSRGIVPGDLIRVNFAENTLTVTALEEVYHQGSDTFADGSTAIGSFAGISYVRFCSVYQTWGPVADFILASKDPKTVSDSDKLVFRTEMFSIFKYNKKKRQVEKLSYDELVGYTASPEDYNNKVVLEVRYFDARSIFIVE